MRPRLRDDTRCAIATTVAEARWRPGVVAAHCSGVTEVAAVYKAACDGAMNDSFQPMQVFGDSAAAVPTGIAGPRRDDCVGRGQIVRIARKVRRSNM